jgi:hypothetical protein
MPCRRVGTGLSCPRECTAGTRPELTGMAGARAWALQAVPTLRRVGPGLSCPRECPGVGPEWAGIGGSRASVQVAAPTLRGRYLQRF